MSDARSNRAPRHVAIIGMSGRFPGASTLEQFWQNLRDGVESITPLSEQELDAAGVERERRQSPGFVPAAAALKSSDQFDAAFFGYSPREADVLDPQQRLFLECSWEAIEHAGYDPTACPGAVGVFGGMSASAYLDQLRSHGAASAVASPFQLAISNDKDYLATRVAYKLNLKGPTITVQTACSTSLVAVALACQSLLVCQCDLALAGGASVCLPSQLGYQYEPDGIMSPDGHCRAFDAAGQGTVFGSGVGVVLLRRLDDAVAAGDNILAVLRGWAINNDGSGKVGYTAPSVDGQAEVIAMAQAVAEVEPDTISYVEAHGTATALGDPIEVAALTQVFAAATSRRNFCALGSVKTNIGHLDTAAGIAGLIKTVLALQHRAIPASLHYRRPNPRIDFANSPFFVNDRLADWPAGPHPRRAGVSSFGIGGANAHVVLEEAPAVAAAPGRPTHLLSLSAKTPAALDAASARLAEHVKQHPEHDLADVAYTLQVGRTAFDHRRVLACASPAEAVAALETLDAAKVFTDERRAGDRPVVFLFPGQGAQYPGMARGLYESEPVFRDAVDRCAQILEPQLGLDVRRLLYPPEDRAAQADRDLAQTALAQPALFVIEYALAQLWEAWGVRPTALLGHSIGEYVAACLAGVFTLEDALALVAARGRLMQALPSGAMLAVPLPEAELRPLLGDDLALAAVNGPALCVASGPAAAVAALERRLAERGLEGVRLRTSHAFHSPAMEPMVEPFVACVRGVELHAPQVPYLSNVTGGWIDVAATTPAYWGEHVRGTVRFAEGLAEVLRLPDAVLLEVGPGHSLGRLAAQHPERTAQHQILASVRHPRDRQPDHAFLLTTLGRLWAGGVPVDWSGFYGEERRRRVALPTYPFARQRHWIERRRPAASEVPLAGALRKREDVGDWFSMPSWQQAMPPPPPRDVTPSCWLILADARGLGERLAERLERAGQQVTIVVAAESFARREDGSFTIAPDQRDQYAALLRELRGLGRLPRTILHLWGVDGADRGGDSLDGLPAALERSFYSLLALAQALADEQVSDPVHLGVVSDGLHVITGAEAPRPAQATAFGPCQVLPLEHPNITCRGVDVALPAAGTEGLDRLSDQLLAEFLSPAAPDIVAYRGPHRWLRTFQPIRIAPEGARAALLRERGVYLITGGLGGVGLVLAEGLARECRARLVLAGRSAFPEREHWDRWLAERPEEDATARRIRKVRELEALGATVLVATVDVADQRQVEALVERAERRFGPLAGVIHAAGVPGGGIIQLKTPEAAAAVLAPKIQGLLALEAALRGAPLDFFVVCSSINAVLAGPGQVDYCAANAFLDAFAHASTVAGRPILAINWDTWAEVGMAVDAPTPRHLEDLRAESLANGIRSREGWAAFRRLLGAPLPQVVVSTRDFSARLGERLDGGMPPTLQGQERAPEQAQLTAHARPLATAFVPPSGEVEEVIAGIWQERLGIERVGRYDDFFELGGHSLLAIQVNAQLRARLQVELSIQTLFDAPTVAKLASVVARSQERAQADNDTVLRMLELVEGLSVDALDRLLNEPAG